MTFARTTLMAALVATIFGFGASAQADSYEHIDGLAVKLQGQARDLYWEFRTHYAHAAHASELLSDASGLYYTAKHAHEVAHSHGSVDHLASDLKKLDKLFHHVKGLVDDIEHDADHGDGHVHGSTADVRTLLSRMEDTLHHLRDDVEDMQHDFHPVVDPDFGHGHFHDTHSPGVTFGVGGLRIRLGH